MTVYKRMMLLMAGMAMIGACQTIGGLIDDAKRAEAECKAQGGAYVLDKGCVAPQPTAPQPEPGPSPAPEPQPQPPVPPPAPAPREGWITLQPGEHIKIPYSPRMEFWTRGIDSRLGGNVEWHIFDFHEAAGGREVANAHMALYLGQLILTKQTYSPMREQAIRDELFFKPETAYRWVVENTRESVAAQIYEGAAGQPVVNIKCQADGHCGPVVWDVPFGSITRVRIGAGTFGGRYVPDHPVEFHIVDIKDSQK